MVLEPVSLKGLLRAWGLEPLIEGGLDGMSDELLARVVPSFTEPSDDMTTAIADGVPVLAPAVHAQRVFDKVGGDGLAFVTDRRWDAFDPPKVAMVSGWGRPGMPVDAVNDRDLSLVNSFSEVLAEPRCLNLQMFHREDEEANAAAPPPSSPPSSPHVFPHASPHASPPPPPPGDRFPVLPDLLDWPCPELFARGRDGPGRDGGCASGRRTSGRRNASSSATQAPFAAVRVDRATRLSRQVCALLAGAGATNPTGVSQDDRASLRAHT